jgi:hypothetical protein
MKEKEQPRKQNKMRGGERVYSQKSNKRTNNSATKFMSFENLKILPDQTSETIFFILN